MIERILIVLFLILVVSAGLIIYFDFSFVDIIFKEKIQKYQLLATISIGVVVAYIAIHDHIERTGTKFKFKIYVKSDMPRMNITSLGNAIRGGEDAISPEMHTTPYINFITIRNKKNKTEIIEKIFMKMHNENYFLLKNYEKNPLVIKPYECAPIALKPILNYKKITTDVARETIKQNYVFNKNFNKYGDDRIVSFLKNKKNELIIQTDEDCFFIRNNSRIKKFNKNFDYFSAIGHSQSHGEVDASVLSIAYIEVIKETFEENSCPPDGFISLSTITEYEESIEKAEKFKLQITQFTNGVFRLCFFAILKEKNKSSIAMNYIREQDIYDAFLKSWEGKEYRELFEEFLNCKEKLSILEDLEESQKLKECQELRKKLFSIITEFIKPKIQGLGHFKIIGHDILFLIGKEIIDKDYKPSAPENQSSKSWVKRQWGRVFSKKPAAQQEETDGTEEEPA